MNVSRAYGHRRSTELALPCALRKIRFANCHAFQSTFGLRKQWSGSSVGLLTSSKGRRPTRRQDDGPPSHTSGRWLGSTQTRSLG
jgi:hypothetical protein